MAKRRFINTRDQSFFGNCIYDQVVPGDHFLCLLNQLIDWIVSQTSSLIYMEMLKNTVVLILTPRKSSKCAYSPKFLIFLSFRRKYLLIDSTEKTPISKK